VFGVFTLGFRHGFDVDHVAAITDISGSQLTRGRAFLLSTAYAVGHGLMLLVLGLGLHAAGWQIPDAGRIIGLTLVLLGGYVLWCAATNRRASSRAGLLATGFGRLHRRLRPRVDIEHEHDHEHGGAHDHDHPDGVGPEAPSAVALRHRHRHRHEDLPAPYTLAGAVAVGAVHGVGAETPTQVLALSSGLAALPPFLIGLFVGNTLVAAAAALGLTSARQRLLNGAVGGFSLLVGIPYLLGTEPILSW
jgi:high-affinity nickel-transport protein